MEIITRALQFNGTIDQSLSKYEQIQYVATQPYFVTMILIVLGAYILINLFNGLTHVSSNQNSKILFQSWVYWRTFLIPLLIAIIVYLIVFYAPNILSIPLNFLGGGV